ncbi:MAG: hypothetical protein EOO46_22945 [Flavobacterium sp.]|nr:MAG: hypothetical protein EOO46_22945 [Flavobacterium sp.]
MWSQVAFLVIFIFDPLLVGASQKIGPCQYEGSNGRFICRSAADNRATKKKKEGKIKFSITFDSYCSKSTMTEHELLGIINEQNEKIEKLTTEINNTTQSRKNYEIDKRKYEESKSKIITGYVDQNTKTNLFAVKKNV